MFYIGAVSAQDKIPDDRSNNSIDSFNSKDKGESLLQFIPVTRFMTKRKHKPEYLNIACSSKAIDY